MSYLAQQSKIQTSSNTYIPISFDDKENTFDVINMSLNNSSRQEQGKVPKLELSRTRSFSRQQSPNSSFRTQTENEANQSILHYTNSLQQHLNTSITRDQAKKQIPIPKPSQLPIAPSSKLNSVKDIINGTQNNLYNYAYQPQRTKRSLSGQIYQSPIYENLLNKQSLGDYSLEYSQNFSTYGGNNILPQDLSLNESRIEISKEAEYMIQDYKQKKEKIKRELDQNDYFENEVQSNLKDLNYLGLRKQDIMKDCIKDLEDLYSRYQKQGSLIDSYISEMNDTSTQNYMTQIKNEQQDKDQQQNINESQYNYSDFQDRKSFDNGQGNQSMSNYETNQFDEDDQQSISQFDQ